MPNFITQSSVYLNAQRQLEMLPSRDRMALKILAITLVLLILFFAVWQPALAYMKDQESMLDQRVALLKLVRENSAVLAAMSKAGGNAQQPTLSSQQLVSSVTNMAQRQGVALKRFEPSGESELKVWVDDVAFDKVVTWLAELKARLGVRVEQISVEKQEQPGLVSARLTLSS